MPAKNKKPAFSIGDWVRVKQVAFSSYDDRYTRTVKTEGPPLEPIVGQICGAVYRYDGVRDPGCWDEPSHFIVKKGYLLWQVRTSVIGKPVEAFEQDIEILDRMVRRSESLLIERNGRPVLPFRPPQRKWDETYPYCAQRLKNELRQKMKSWPRDRKGRWMKK